MAGPATGVGLPADLLRRSARQGPRRGRSDRFAIRFSEHAGAAALRVRNKAVHVALGVRTDGTKEILVLWLKHIEGAKFWLRVLNELRNRSVEDILT